jgi:hypothetical protein
MSKQQQFGLNFYRWRDPKTNAISNICQRQTVDSYSELQILSRLDAIDTQYIINQVNSAETSNPFNSTPNSDSYEDLSIEIVFPNVIINDILTLSISDFKSLLQEWIVFIS